MVCKETSVLVSGAVVEHEHHEQASLLVLGKQVWVLYIRRERQEKTVWGGDRPNPHVAELSSFRDSE